MFPKYLCFFLKDYAYKGDKSQTLSKAITEVYCLLGEHCFFQKKVEGDFRDTNLIIVYSMFF